MLSEILEQSKKNKQIMCFYHYNDDDFWCGYVTDYNQDLVYIQHLTKYGFLDGIVVERIDGLKNIEFGDDYSKAMQYLSDNTDKIISEPEYKFEIPTTENWQHDVLKQFLGVNRLIRLEMNKSDYIHGFVEKLSETEFILNQVGKMGEDEFRSVFKIEDVTAFRLNEMDARKRLLLYNWRKSIDWLI